MDDIQKTPQVLLLEPMRRYNTDELRTWGDIRTLFASTGLPGRARPSFFKPMEFGEAAVAALIEESFEPTRDFIALSGPLIGLVPLFAIIGARFGHFRYLYYDQRLERYVDLEMNLSHFQKESSHAVRERPAS